MSEKVVVIGGTAAGLSAASKAKRLKPDLDIKVFEKSGYISYGACGLPYYVGDMIEDPEDLVSLTVDQITNKRNIPTMIHREVTVIDRDQKQVTVKDLDTDQIEVYPYDKLVIATGAQPIKPNLPGIGAAGIYYLRTVEDGIRLKKKVKAEGKQTAAIIGGGFIGLEVAEEMTFAGIEVHVYEAMPRLLPFLEESFSEMILDELEKNGVHVHLGSKVEEFQTTDGWVSGIKTADGDSLEVDFVLMSIGVLPNTELAKEAGLETGIKGAIVVNDQMQTSDPSIYACGDCVQMKNRITGSAVYVPLGTTANKQGRIAGENVAGGKEAFPGVLGSMVTKVFDLYIAATGLTVQQAADAGYDVAVSVVTKGDKASYYPGSRENHICLILDRKTGKLLGAQAVGSESVAGRMNVFVTAITCQMTVEEINGLDLVYAPAVAPVYDPILIAASQAMKKVDRQEDGM